MTRWAVLAGVCVVAAAGLAGCSAQECDPHRVGNLFTATGCAVSGGFSDHVAQVRREVEVLRRDVALTRQEAAAYQREADRLAADRSALEAQVEDQQLALDRLQLDLVNLRATSDRERAQIEVMERELAAAQSDLDSMGRPGVPPEEIARLRGEVEERKRLLDAYLGTIRQE